MKENIRFVSLHSHDNGSVGDALGSPKDYANYIISLGGNATAITNHGNCNSIPAAMLYQRQLKEKEQQFKFIYGVEAYFIDSLEQWRKDYAAYQAEYLEKKKKLSKALEAAEEETVTAEDEEETKTQHKFNPINSRSHLVLLAQNATGYKNLCKLVSLSYRQGNFYRYPRIDFDLLRQYSEGLVCLSACIGGRLCKCYWDHKDEGFEAILAAMLPVAKDFKSIFGERYFLELQWNRIPEQHEYNRCLIELSKRTGIELVTTLDCHYPNPDLWQSREVYKRISFLNAKKESKPLPQSLAELPCELYPKNGEQVFDLYKRMSAEAQANYDEQLVLESIERTQTIVDELIEDYEIDTTIRFPSFIVPQGKTDIEYLSELCHEALKERQLDNKPEYVQRLKHELSVIKKRNFSRYFLLYRAVVKESQSIQLTGTGRGSAGGSLISYLLGIIQVDPIRFGMQFERFLDAEGEAFPDIDLDHESVDLLKRTLQEKWKEAHNIDVVPISNISTLQLRSLIKDVAKFYEIPFAEVNEVTGKMIDEATPAAKEKNDIKAGAYVPTFEEVVEFSGTLKRFFSNYPDVSKHIKALQGAIRSTSTHASGVLFEENLEERMPLIRVLGTQQTPWTEGVHQRHLEPMGFLKYDLLGLATLSMIHKAIELVLKRHKEVADPSLADVWKFYNEHLHPDRLDITDQKVYETVFHDSVKLGTGIFQFTNNGARRFCTSAKPRSIEEVSAITSIYRPGPLSNSSDKLYLERDNTYTSERHPLIQDVLKDTRDLLCYQEQIALLAHKLGKNISLSEGNKLRKLLVKKGIGETKSKLTKIRSKFVEGCLEKGISENETNDLWAEIEAQNTYLFNFSHSLCYSLISFQSAWLLTYYPVEWVCAFLDKEPEERKERAINFAKANGFKIKPVDINYSGLSWDIGDDNETLIQPLVSVKGIGQVVVGQLLANRPFKTIEDVLYNENMSYQKVNKRVLDILVRSQALNSLMDSRFTGLKHFWSCVAVERAKTREKFQQNIELFKPEGDFSKEEKIQYLTELTGIYPLNLIISDADIARMKILGVPPLGEFDPSLQVCWFVAKDMEPKKTKTGKLYWVIDAIDETSTTTQIRCWGIDPIRDVLKLNKVIMARLEYSEQWGYSVRNVRYNFKTIG